VREVLLTVKSLLSHHILRAFDHILKKDKAKHGNGAQFEILDRQVDETQQEVDELIEAISAGTSASTEAVEGEWGGKMANTWGGEGGEVASG
jgi:hypothetical protein